VRALGVVGLSVSGEVARCACLDCAAVIAARKTHRAREKGQIQTGAMACVERRRVGYSRCQPPARSKFSRIGGRVGQAATLLAHFARTGLPGVLADRSCGGPTERARAVLVALYVDDCAAIASRRA
jgi:hypothetical protein